MLVATVALQGQILLPILSGAPTGGGAGGFSHLHTITVDPTKVPSNQTNFPVYFGGTYAWLATVANGGQIVNSTTCCANTETVPADLIFTSDSGCTMKLNWDIPFWNPTTGAIEVHIQDSLSSLTGTIIYACTGSAGTTTFQSTYTSTWDSNYVAVWHFGDGTTLDLHDSTTNANTCTNHSATATTPLLATGGGINLVAASTQYADCGAGASLNITGPLQMESLMNINGLPTAGNFYFLLSNTGASLNNGYQLLIHDASGNCSQCLYGSLEKASVESTTNSALGMTFTFPANATTYLAMAHYDQGVTNHFDAWMNTTNNTTTIGSSAIGSSANNFIIGRSLGSANYCFNGVLDEMRISKISRSNDWQTTEVNSLTSPSTFYAVVSVF